MVEWNVMTSRSRFKHPSRKYFYDFLESTFGSSRFALADIGVVSMVDYLRLRKEKPNLSFTYTGFDLNEEIIEQARSFVQKGDRVILWDIHDPHPDSIREQEFDVILVKHMIHYCKHYDVLENLKPVLKTGGAIVVINNGNIYSSKNTCKYDGKTISYAFGRYGSTYSEKAYVKYLHKNFEIVKHMSFRRSKVFKAYTIDILKA